MGDFLLWLENGIVPVYNKSYTLKMFQKQFKNGKNLETQSVALFSVFLPLIPHPFLP